MSVQVLITKYLETGGRSYPVGTVVTFPDDREGAWVVSGSFGTTNSSAITAAISGGAPQLTHIHAAALPALTVADGPSVGILGSSYPVGGAVTADGKNGKNYSTNRSIHGWVNALLGRVWRNVYEYGKNGDCSRSSANGVGMVARYETDVLAGPVVQDVILSGHIINTGSLGFTVAQYAADVDSICMRTALMGHRLWIEEDPIVDAIRASSSRLAFHNLCLQFLRTLPSRYSHVRLVPVAKYFDAAVAQYGSTQACSWTADSTHPAAPGNIHGYAPAWKEASAGILVPMQSEFTGPDDPYAIACFPLLSGNVSPGAGAPNFLWFNQGAGSSITGTGPKSMAVTTSAVAGLAVVSSKVPHPLGRELECWKLDMSTGANAGDVTVSQRDHVVSYTWTSGGAVTDLFRFVRPTVANDRIYRVLVGGNLATGSDPTASWTTEVGAIFTSGTATLICCPDFASGTRRARGLLGLLIDQTAYTASTRWTIETNCGFYNSGNTNATLAGSSGMFTGLPNTIGYTATWGDLGGIDNLGTDALARLMIATKPDPAAFIPNNADYHKNFSVFRLGANSRVVAYIDEMGSRFVL